MKRIALFLISLSAGTAWASLPGPGEVSRTVRQPDSYASDAVYQSSIQCNGSTLQTIWVSSPSIGVNQPNQASLWSIKVSSPGSGGSFFEVWDGVGSTQTARRVDYVNSMIATQHFYSVSISSWLGVSNQPGPAGGNPACIDILYRLR